MPPRSVNEDKRTAINAERKLKAGRFEVKEELGGRAPWSRDVSAPTDVIQSNATDCCTATIAIAEWSHQHLS